MFEAFNTQRGKMLEKYQLIWLHKKKKTLSSFKKTKRKTQTTDSKKKKASNKTDKYIIHLLYKKIIQFDKKNTKKSINKWSKG